MIVKFNFDGKTVSAQKGYTILQAMSYINTDIPHLCSYKTNSTNTYEEKNKHFNVQIMPSESKKEK